MIEAIHIGSLRADPYNMGIYLMFCEKVTIDTVRVGSNPQIRWPHISFDFWEADCLDCIREWIAYEN